MASESASSSPPKEWRIIRSSPPPSTTFRRFFRRSVITLQDHLNIEPGNADFFGQFNGNQPSEMDCSGGQGERFWIRQRLMQADAGKSALAYLIYMG